jgi:hypothetical protein
MKALTIVTPSGATMARLPLPKVAIRVQPAWGSYDLAEAKTTRQAQDPGQTGVHLPVRGEL